MKRPVVFLLLALFLTTSCAAPQARAQELDLTATVGWALLVSSGTGLPLPSAEAAVTPASASTETQSPSMAPSLAPTFSASLPTTAIPPATGTPTAAPPATVNNLAATVSVRFLSCRYGPGPEYLYLYALRGGANIKLIGRTDGDNWHWAWVDGRNKCWVNTSYLAVQGDWRQLPIVYPGIAKLPVSPYYPPTSVTSARRNGNAVTIDWRDIPLRAGDEEDDSMQHYIVEAWHCRGGTLLFEPFATNDTDLTIIDEPGCTQPSHARLFVQEKHGFSGPTEIPWPAH